jgi:hypothetical protein
MGNTCNKNCAVIPANEVGLNKCINGRSRTNTNNSITDSKAITTDSFQREIYTIAGKLFLPEAERISTFEDVESLAEETETQSESAFVYACKREEDTSIFREFAETNGLGGVATHNSSSSSLERAKELSSSFLLALSK